MDGLRKYLARIQAQLTGLTVSQRLLIGLLLVVMVGAIYFTVVLSAKPEMVVLIPQSMTPEEINRAEMYLKGKYDYTVDGDKIMVPAEKAYEIRGELFAAQALPKDTTVAFAKLVEANNPFTTDANSARQWNYATQETLTRMLRYFPYVEDGTVIISRGERSGLGRNAVPSSATVTLKVKNNAGLTSNQVVAIVDMIRGAVAGLSREDVHITDGQREYHAPSGDTQMPTDMMEYKKAVEDDFSRKLYVMFGEIPTVKIAVNADLIMSMRKIEQTQYDPKPVKADTQETTKDLTTTDGPAGPGGEPGMASNVGMAANNGGSGGGHKSSTTQSDSVTQTMVKIGDTVTETVAPPGTELKDVTASISIPRSYFVAIYQRLKHDPKADPDDEKDAEFARVIKQEEDKVTALAKNCIGAKSDDQIHVDWFDDTIAARPVETPVVGAFNGASLTALLSQHAKQGVLALVALCVLGWMMMMVKRAVPQAAGADLDGSVFGEGGGKGSKRKGEGGDMDVGDDVYGEANEGDAVLTGIELDDDTLASRKMVDEVSTMIKENPENAATLVKRWMAKTK